MVVVGSINQDYVLRVDRRPRPGETITGGVLEITGGGKGANQAVAAASHGASTALVAMVGEDDIGESLCADLEVAGVDTRWVTPKPGVRSGTAFITVTPDGQNQIIVASGANALMDKRDLANAAPALCAARVLLLQLEIPIDAVSEAASAASASTTVVLNASPARQLPPDLLRRVDVLIVNEGEAAMVLDFRDTPKKDAGKNPEQDVETMVRRLRSLGPGTVIITRGAAGVTAAIDRSSWEEPSPPTKVVDTTGAGDVFAGVLGAELAHTTERVPEEAAFRRAVGKALRAASDSVSRVGARV